MIRRNMHLPLEFPTNSFPSEIQNKDSVISMKNKILVKENSVWKEYAYLNQNLILNNTHFDLLKLNGLYAFNIGNLLKNWRYEACVSQKFLNKLLNKNKDYFGLIERNKRGLPLKTLFELGVKLEVIDSKLNFYKELEKHDLLYSMIGKSNKIRLPKITELKEILAFIYPQPNYQFLCSVKSKIPTKLKSELNKRFLFPIITKNGDGYDRFYVRSYTLNLFLRKFFIFKEKCRLNFPLSEYIKHNKDKIDLTKGVIIPLLQSDGYPWGFANKCKVLHDVLVDAFYYEYNVYPNSYMVNETDGCTQTRYMSLDKNIKEKICLIGGHIKGTPNNNQTKEDYLKESQPHLNYLFDADRATQIAALQMFFAAEGYVLLSKTRGSNCVKPLIGIACSNPNIHQGLIELSKKKFNVNFISIKKERYWSGLHEIITSSLEAAINLLKIEPFIKGIKIERGNFKGFDKREVLLAILEYRHREKQEIVNRNLTRDRKIYNILRILKNKEFKSSKAYIRLYEEEKL